MRKACDQLLRKSLGLKIDIEIFLLRTVYDVYLYF